MRSSAFSVIALLGIALGATAAPVAQVPTPENPEGAGLPNCVENCVYNGSGPSGAGEQSSGGGQGGIKNVLGGGVTDVAGTAMAGALGQ